MKKYKLNYKKIKRNILIILFLILFIKYIKYMNNYNKKSLATFNQYSTQCEITGAKVNQEDYKTYIKNLNK